MSTQSVAASKGLVRLNPRCRLRIQAPLGGSEITLTVASGSTGVGPLYSPGSIQVSDTDGTAGNVNICGNVIGQSVAITTPAITFTNPGNPGTIVATGGGVALQGNTSGTNALNLTFIAGSGISAPNQTINFNPSSPGPITTISKALGDIAAGPNGSVGVNGGLSGNVLLNVNSINCCVKGLGPDRPAGSGVPLGGLTVTVQVATGNASIGPISAVGAVNASTTDPTGSLSSGSGNFKCSAKSAKSSITESKSSC